MIDNETDANISLFAKEMLERMKYPNKSLLDTDTGKKLQLKDLKDPQEWYREWQSEHDKNWDCVPKWDVIVEDCKQIAKQSDHPRKNSFWAACFFLSDVFKKGIGVEKDEKEAGEWEKMFKELEEIDDRIKQDYDKGGKSVFLSALELASKGTTEKQGGILATIHDLPIHDLPFDFPYAHLHFVRFLYDFWSQSPGNEFWSLWKPYSSARTPEKVKCFDHVWKAIYGTDDEIDANNNDDSRLTKIKSKCWVLAAEERGGHSEVWDCLRDAIDSYEDNDGHISVSNQNNDNRKFITLLQSAPNSVEWREYCRLVEILARHESPKEEAWIKLVENCRNILGRSAKVDWYLRLKNSTEAEYGVGFDKFPYADGYAGDGTTIGRSKDFPKQFTIDGTAFSIKGNDSPTWFRPIPWNRSVKVCYAGKNWETLNESDESCFFSTAQQTYGVFVRYRSVNGDATRSHWWTKESSPQMLFAQSDFLICARDEEKMEKLRLSAEDGVAWSDNYTEGVLSISSPDTKEKAYLPYRIYSITERPANADPYLFLWEGDPVSTAAPNATIKIIGKKASAHVIGNGLGIQLADSPSRLIAFPSEKLRLHLENARPNGNYKWDISIDGQSIGEENGTDASFSLADIDAGNTIRNLSVSCKETIGGQENTTQKVSGVVLPDAARGSIVAETQLPANWKWRTSETSPIGDRLEGLKKWKIEDPTGRCITIGKPDTTPAWWFEEGQKHYWDDDNTELYREDSPIREFTNMEEAWNWALCLPPKGDEPCPEGWDVTDDGYWRCPLSRLPGMGDIESFQYNPDAGPDEFRDKNGIVLFRYRYSPDKPTFCLCKSGTLGLFVPKGTATQFDILAFSDKTKDLLFLGKRLARTQPNVRFTDIQSDWDVFCRETQGWDAVLVALPTSEDGFRLFHSSMEGSVAPYRLRKGEGQSYDEDHLALSQVVKSICCNLPTMHPARSLRLFETSQTAPYDCVKKTWEEQVNTLCRNPFSEETWQDLLEEWKASGFHPLLEGIAPAVCLAAVGDFFSHPPSAPFDWINGASKEWADFVHKWATKEPYPDEIYDDTRKLACDGQNHRMTDKTKAALAKCLIDFREQRGSSKKNSRSNHPSAPFDWIDVASHKWAEFVEKWTTKEPYPGEIYDEARKLACDGQNHRMTDKTKAALAKCLIDFRERLESFKVGVLSELIVRDVCMPPSWSRNCLCEKLKSECDGRRGHGVMASGCENCPHKKANKNNEWSSAICHAANISNSVSGEITKTETHEGRRWVSLYGYCTCDKSPASLLSSIPEAGRGKDLLVSILSWMSEGHHRACGGQPLDVPTDREWIFCLAATIALVPSGDTLPPLLRSTLVKMIPSIRADQEKWKLLEYYLSVCRSILNLPQVKAQ